MLAPFLCSFRSTLWVSLWSLDLPARRTLQLWARFLAADTADELRQLAEEDAIMAKAKEAHATLTADPETARELRHWQDMIDEAAIAEVTGRHMAHQAGKREGLREGKQKGLREGKQEGLREGKQEGLREGKAAGLREGEEKGRNEGLRQAARRMVDSGLPVAEVAAVLGLTVDEVEPGSTEN